MSPIGGFAIAGIDMAEPRRRPGLLRETVLRMLIDAGRPLSGTQLRELVREHGLSVQQSLIFRAIRQLIDRGTIRKIWAAGGYAPDGGGPTITLVCRQCGRVVEIAHDETFVALGQMAAVEGFAISRPIVEVSGICAACSSLAVSETRPERAS